LNFIGELKLLRLATHLLKKAHEPILKFLGDTIGKPVEAPEKSNSFAALSA
jgi:hypothetical protein